MSRTIDLSTPRWVRVTVVFVLLGGGAISLFAALLDIVLEATGVVPDGAYVESFAVGLVIYVVGCAVWAIRTRRDSGEPVWNSIPGRQYTGRHAESGGIARKEQEDAIQELKEREQ